MKFLIACALLAVASADVSHLSRSYLPPGHSGSSFTYSGGNGGVHSSYQGPAVHYSHVQQPGFVQQTYTAPAVHHSVAPAPVNEYLPPVQESYAGPSVSYTGHGVHQTYGAPNYSGVGGQQYYPSHSVGYTGPTVHQSYGAPSFSYSGGSSGTQYASNGGYIYRKK